MNKPLWSNEAGTEKGDLHVLFAQPYGCHATYIKQMFVCGAA
jgi:hypothetical protein